MLCDKQDFVQYIRVTALGNKLPHRKLIGKYRRLWNWIEELSIANFLAECARVTQVGKVPMPAIERKTLLDYRAQ